MTEVKANSTGIFDDSDPKETARRVAFSYFRSGLSAEEFAKAFKVAVGDARRFKREYEDQREREARREARQGERDRSRE